MLKQLVYPLYDATHRGLFWSRNVNPWFKKRYGKGPFPTGHISAEHLQHPELDEALAEAFAATGISVQPYRIGVEGYRTYLQRANYPDSYYGGGKDPHANFTEKTLEHYVSTDFIKWGEDCVLVDIAACTSPFSELVKEFFPLQTTYQQDLIYPAGIHGRRIGGWAHELHLPDASVDAVTLHCSLEHFEGNSDTRFFQELERVLKPGGRAIILPFYLANTYTIHVDPAFNWLKGHRPDVDPRAQLRYCSWKQYFSRHYDPIALRERVLNQAPSLRLELYRVENFQEVDPSCYLRFIGVFEKTLES